MSRPARIDENGMVETGFGESRVWIQRGDDGFWLMMETTKGRGAIHLDEPRGSITRVVLESCVSEDLRTVSEDA